MTFPLNAKLLPFLQKMGLVETAGTMIWEEIHDDLDNYTRHPAWMAYQDSGHIPKVLWTQMCITTDFNEHPTILASVLGMTEDEYRRFIEALE